MEEIINLNNFRLPEGLIFKIKNSDDLFMLGQDRLSEKIINLNKGLVFNLEDFVNNEVEDYEYFKDEEDEDFVGVILVTNSIADFQNNC